VGWRTKTSNDSTIEPGHEDLCAIIRNLTAPLSLIVATARSDEAAFLGSSIDDDLLLLLGGDDQPFAGVGHLK
jgi:hypothetical protein